MDSSHLSLLVIAPGNSSRWHPVSAQRRKISKRILLMNLFLLAWFVRWKLVVQWLFCTVLLLGFVQNGIQHPCIVPFSFFSRHFVKVQVMQPYNSTDMAIAWKNICFILSRKPDFYIVNQSMIYLCWVGLLCLMAYQPL